MTFANRNHGGSDQRGFALIASLVVLMLTAILAITYFTMTTSERSQSAVTWLQL